MTTQSVLTVETNKYYEHSTVRTLENYALRDVTTGQIILPKSIGLISRFEKFKQSSFNPQSRFYVNLVLPSSIDCNHSYILSMANGN